MVPTRSPLLSQREREVLREIAKGRFSKEIAATFNLSVFTVENIRRRIMRKTGLKSVAELTLHALRLRLITSPVTGTSKADPDSAAPLTASAIRHFRTVFRSRSMISRRYFGLIERRTHTSMASSL